eukprot:g20229.t1
MIALNKTLSANVFGSGGSDENDMTTALRTESDVELPGATPRSLSAVGVDPLSAAGSAGEEAVGVAWAVLVGVAGGSVLAPSHYTSAQESGLAFIPSFGLGAMIASPILTVLWFSFMEKKSPDWQFAGALPVGILSGFLWNISNVFAIIAIPSLGYGVAYPILQCALFVAGVWGIVVFKEIQGKDIIVFFLGGIVLICGAVLVALAA